MHAVPRAIEPVGVDCRRWRNAMRGIVKPVAGLVEQARQQLHCSSGTSGRLHRDERGDERGTVGRAGRRQVGGSSATRRVGMCRRVWRTISSASSNALPPGSQSLRSVRCRPCSRTNVRVRLAGRRPRRRAPAPRPTISTSASAHTQPRASTRDPVAAGRLRPHDGQRAASTVTGVPQTVHCGLGQGPDRHAVRTCPALGGLDRVAQQHRPRRRPDPAEAGRDPARDLGARFVDVGNDPAPLHRDARRRRRRRPASPCRG